MKSTVRKEESGGFGKDYGLIHEAIITGKKVGAGKDFWSALAHNKDLFEKTRAFVESGGVTSTGELSFPSWKTITLGTHKDTKALFKALENTGVNISYYTRFMAKHSIFSIATAETEINLVKVTVAELGFPNGATRAQIYEAALKQGLFLCPAEVGPQVRLQYLHCRLELLLHPDKIYIKTLASGVDFLGWVNFPKHRVLRTATKQRMLKRIVINPQNATLQSYLGLLGHGDTNKLREEIINQAYLWK